MVEPVTVIIPARNAAGTVRSAVASTLRDLGPNDRVIVTDDGSDDATADRLSRILDVRLRVVHHDRSEGVASSLNELLELVRTPIVARMDADDLVLPGRFLAQRRRLEVSGAAVVFGRRVNFGRSPLSFLPPRLPALSAHEMPVALTVCNPVAHPTMLGRTDVLKSHGGYRVSPAEDYEFWLRLAAGDVALESVPRPVLLYRMHNQQVSRHLEWFTRLRRDPDLVASHDRLLGHLGWTGPSAWSALHSVETEHERAILHDLRAFLVNLLGQASRPALSRLVDRELARRGV
jgi:glycosyltransferase involved in cell wall biosynthesis